MLRVEVNEKCESEFVPRAINRDSICWMSDYFEALLLRIDIEIQTGGRSVFSAVHRLLPLVEQHL